MQNNTGTDRYQCREEQRESLEGFRNKLRRRDCPNNQDYPIRVHIQAQNEKKRSSASHQISPMVWTSPDYIQIFNTFGGSFGGSLMLVITVMKLKGTICSVRKYDMDYVKIISII